MSITSAAKTTPCASISAFVICCNEEAHIRRCLESVKWCDEIVVVDSGSNDRTLEICREYTQRIFTRPWPGFVKQKRFALEQCTSDWVLNIDADEEVSEGLKAEILNVLATAPTRSDSPRGYFLSRVVYYMGRWWRRGGWYPEYRLRLCARANTSWGGDDPHEKAIVDGTVARLEGELHHYTYDDLSSQVRSLNNLSSSAAQTMFQKRERANLVDILIRPVLRFLKFYLIKRGFREGFPGFVAAVLEGYYVFLKYVKLWELSRR